MKKIILYILFTSLHYLTFCQDTSRLSDMQRLVCPDSLISECIYIRRADTMFLISKYPYRDPIFYEYVNTFYHDSGNRWHKQRDDGCYMVYYMRKTRRFIPQLNGYEYKPRRIIIYKDGEKVRCTYYVGNICYDKKYTHQ